jgi:hypothetical protein
MTGEVRELLDLFPWFHSAHLLLLKGLHNTGDVKFENQLRQSAVHVSDREVLYYILHKQAPVENEKHAIPAASDVFQPELPDNQQVVIESGKNSSDIINELEKALVILTRTEAPISAANDSKETIVVTTESEIDESASIMLVIEDGDNHIEETVFFMDPSISTPDQGELLELEENAQELTEDSRIKTGVSENLPSGEQNIRQIQSKLIDDFILLNPRIEPSREKHEEQNEDISKPFIEEKGAFITETLATIYINQGYYSRAIDIYEKLSLKFPEKSSYFATQIEKVKELIK